MAKKSQKPRINATKADILSLKHLFKPNSLQNAVFNVQASKNRHFSSFQGTFKTIRPLKEEKPSYLSNLPYSKQKRPIIKETATSKLNRAQIRSKSRKVPLGQAEAVNNIKRRSNQGKIRF